MMVLIATPFGHVLMMVMVIILLIIHYACSEQPRRNVLILVTGPKGKFITGASTRLYSAGIQEMI